MLQLDRRLFLAGAASGIVAARAGATAFAAKPAPDFPVPVNPLVKQRADAQVFLSEDSWYYLTGSVPEYDRLVLRRSRTIAGLATAEERVLWRHLASGPLSGFIWAPELHLIDGKWIMYFAAGPSGGGEDVFRIRTWAVVCDGPDPMTGNWNVLGQFEAPWDSFNLDSTVFVHKGKRYFIWAQREPGIETNSNLYIAPLASPLKLGGPPARLTVPTLDWEIRGFKVNEGAAVLARNGRLFMTYSASATDARYVLGMLTASEDADILNPASWTKSPVPVFESSSLTSVYGPGHNSFTIDEYGRDVLVYHGRDYEKIEGDPLFDPNRHTRVQRIYYRDDGTPDFGIPVGNGPVPDRYSLPGDANACIRHDGNAILVERGPIAPSQWRQVPSPLGNGAVSLAPIDAPGKRIAAMPDGQVVLLTAGDDPDVIRATSFVVQNVGSARVRIVPATQPRAVLRAVASTLRAEAASGAGDFFAVR